MEQEENRMKYCERCGALLNENGICPACGYAQQPTKPKKDRTALMVVIVVVVILLLCVALFFTCLHLFNRLWGAGDRGESSSEDRNITEEWDRGGLPEETAVPDKDPSGPDDGFLIPGDGEEPDASLPEDGATYIGNGLYESTFDTTETNRQEGGQDETLPYYSGPYNDLKDNLSYQITFLNTSCYTEEGNVYLSIEYPQIVSDRADEEKLNAELAYEYEYFRDFYLENVADDLSADGFFYFFSDAYVTYMDENVLSVVYSEKIRYLDGSDTFSDINFYCVNIDLTTGNILTNTDILALDDNFAVDFREREAEENGDEALTGYTDQEILAMLKDESTLVLFYTPMGMEVGVNLEGQIVYVTYEDYEKYLNVF